MPSVVVVVVVVVVVASLQLQLQLQLQGSREAGHIKRRNQANDVIQAFTIKSKQARVASLKQVANKMIKHFVSDSEDKNFLKSQIEFGNFALDEVKADILRHDVLTNNIRIDGSCFPASLPVVVVVVVVAKQLQLQLQLQGSREAGKQPLQSTIDIRQINCEISLLPKTHGFCAHKSVH